MTIVDGEFDGLIARLRGLHIEALGLSTRAVTALARRGIVHVGELCNLSGRELLRMRGIGEVTLREIEEKLMRWLGSCDKTCKSCVKHLT